MNQANSAEGGGKGAKESWFTLADGPVILLLGLVILLFFHKLGLSNLILGRGDTLLYFYPYWQAAADALRSGEIPLWNPNLFMGAPFMANSQIGFFYPLNWPLWLMFPAPVAVKWSILLHMLIAGTGVYLAARRLLALNRLASFFAAAFFVVGGYLSAQVEHVNQLQGLAWLPWLFAAIGPASNIEKPANPVPGRISAVAIVLAMQLLAGHTQSTFIAVTGVVIWMMVEAMIGARSAPGWSLSGIARIGIRRFIRRVRPLVLGGVLGGAFASIQLVPTIELIGHSARQGGLPINEALSFSLHPLLLARSLLPGYGQSIFSEYEAFMPLTALALSVVGLRDWRINKRLLLPVLMAAAGLFLALGLYNPVYHLLVRLPGFGFFRAPARWLVLYSFGISLLAGQGWQNLASSRSTSGTTRAGRPTAIAIFAVLFLILGAPISTALARYVPFGSEVSPIYPSTTSWLGWIVELSLISYLFWLSVRTKNRGRPTRMLLPVLALVASYMASRSLPYNQLTAAAAYADIRPPVALIGSQDRCIDTNYPCGNPQGRLLSMSDIFFDIGDQAELESAYGDQLDESGLYDLIVATKHKEVVDPNLSLAFGLSSVDGFDGGLLPLKRYSIWSALLLGREQRTSDGRLREYLESTPEASQLDSVNARYLITDKVGDSWRDGVFFDLQHSLSLDQNEPSVDIGYLPEFEATEVWLIADGQGQIEVKTASGERWELVAGAGSNGVTKVIWPEPAVATEIWLKTCTGNQPEPGGCLPEWQVQGLTLVDSRDGTFRTLVPGQYKLIHSGDVKVYQNLDALERVQLYYDWQTVEDGEQALGRMLRPDYDPRRQVIVETDDIEESASQGDGRTNVLEYADERIRVQVDTEKTALLLVRDAHYPGWTATVDGLLTPIYQTNILFRGVFVPPGHHIVEMTFRPQSLSLGLSVTLVAISIWAFVVAVTWRRKGLD